MINKNYKKLENNYIFSEISSKIKQFSKTTNKELYNLSVGDVSLPIDKKIIKVMKKSLNEQNGKKSFKGYPPEEGYKFLKDRIVWYYENKNIKLNSEEVFISNGAGCDLGNLLDIFNTPNVITISPSYPAYYDSSVIKGCNVITLTEDEIPYKNSNYTTTNLQNSGGYVVFLCSPNNPTGRTYSYKELESWVDFCNKTNSVIVYDIAYESYVDGDYPRSIYEIKNAKKCAIEVGSFSKLAGFTNLRCGWTIVPDELVREEAKLNNLWRRRQCTFFNGVPYHIQKAAEYVMSGKGLKICSKQQNYYKNNVKLLKNALLSANIEYLHGDNSPFVWVKCPQNYSSWDYFNELLNDYGIVCVPGCGFGKYGEGYVRLSGFAKKEVIKKACEKILKNKKHPTNL